MNKEKIMKKKATKTIHISIRITQALKEWIKKQKFSPTAIFNEACKELGFQNKK